MKTRRFWFVLTLFLVLGMALAACGGPAAEPVEEVEEAAEEAVEEAEEAVEEAAEEVEEAAEEVVEEEEPMEPFRVAVVTPSAPNDLAFSQSMVDALMLIQEEMGGEEAMELAISDSLFVVEDAAAAIRDYASEGYDLVIAHGSQYGGSLQEIAPDFPETSFAWGTAGDTFGLDNVYAYEAASDQGGFVNGALAGLLTESNVIGVVGPIEVGDAKLYVDGFVEGVAFTNPDATVNVNYIGSFSDVALASEAAQAHVSAGADIMTGTAQMVVGAVGVAEENDVLWFGTQANQTELAPDFVVASQVYHWEVILSDIIDGVQNGELGGESFVITLANGGEVVELNEDFAVPDEAVTQVEETVDGIISGDITIELPTE